MTVFDWVLVALSLALGALFTCEVPQLLAKRRRDSEFSRNWAVGGQLDHKTGLITGVHAEGVPAVDILQRELATGAHPVAERTAGTQ
ncbi:MAG: hypothetical protein ACRDQF_10215 [Thermocrispum sp.]